MATTTDLEKLVINYLTQDQYDDAREAGTLNANELYLTPDTGSTGGTVTSVATGGGLTGGPITSSGTISHDDTSSQSSVSNSGRTYIQSVTLDTYGHVTGLSSATETVTNSDEKLGTDAVTSGTTYYIVAGTNTTGAERKKYDASGIAYKATNGTANGTNGEALLTLGNSTASTSANWKAGKIFLYSSSAYGGTLVPEAITSSSKTWTLPNKTGTVALTDDIPDVSSFITTDSDEKLKTVALTSGTTYYPILATGANAAANRQVDSTLGGLKYVSTAGTTSAVGTATLYLGNSTASGSSGTNNEQGVLRQYGTTAYYHDIKAYTGYPAANRTIYLPRYTSTMYLTCTSTTSAVGGATTAPVYVDDTGRIQAVTSIPYTLLTGTPTIPTDTNTTYTLTNALSSHKFTWTFTAGGSGSGSTTTTAELVQGSNITLTDDTTNKKITIAATDTTYGIATYNTAGLVKPWKSYTGSASGPTAATASTAPTVNSISTDSGKYYAVEIDKDGRMFVNVPWTGGTGTDSDEKLKVEEVSTSLTTYYFILSDGTTNASIRQIDSDSLWYQEQAGVANSSMGLAALHIGNGKTYAEGNKEGRLFIHGNSQGYYICLMSNSLTSSHTLTFPDKAGTIALTSDIPTITLNGTATTSPSFYAPTSAGTSGYYLKSNGSGEPSWAAIETGGTGTVTTWYGTCSTTASTTAKAVTCSNFTLSAGAIIGVLFSTANTAATPTLNVNSTGAKTIYVGGNTALSSTTNVLKWSANTMVYFMYDGTYFRYITSVSAASVVPSRGANTWYGTSSTTATTAAKTSTIDNYVLTKGSLVSVTFSTANTYVAGAITLNINSTGAKTIYYNNAATSTTNTLLWDAGETLTFIYSGSYYYFIGKTTVTAGEIVRW